MYSVNFGLSNTVLKKASRMAMNELGLLLKNRAQRRTPVDTGFLRTSAQNSISDLSSMITAKVEYTADYATYVHENLNSRHPTGQAKFLRDALYQDVAPKVDEIVKKHIKF